MIPSPYLSPHAPSPAFAAAIGQFVASFAHLEWQVLFATERMKSGTLRNSNRLEAGKVAHRFKSALDALPSAPEAAIARELADEFSELVCERNHLLHARRMKSAETDLLLRIDPKSMVVREWDAEMIDRLCRRADLLADAITQWRERNEPSLALLVEPTISEPEKKVGAR